MKPADVAGLMARALLDAAVRLPVDEDLRRDLLLATHRVAIFKMCNCASVESGAHFHIQQKAKRLSLPDEFGRKRLARGILTPIKTAKSGKSFYCLQYTKARKHVTKYVPSAELELWREATENDRLFQP